MMAVVLERMAAVEAVWLVELVVVVARFVVVVALVSITLTSLEKRCVKVHKIVSHLMKFETYDPVLRDSKAPVLHQQFKTWKKVTALRTFSGFLRTICHFSTITLLSILSRCLVQRKIKIG